MARYLLDTCVCISMFRNEGNVRNTLKEIGPQNCYISEITIPAPDNSPEGEEIQARIVRDCYRLWFSWPSVYRITFWNLVDYTFYKENLASGLYAPDMRKKPAYHVLDQLINHEWRTSIEVHAKGGKVAFRGFRGRYRLTWMESEGRRKEKFIDLQ